MKRLILIFSMLSFVPLFVSAQTNNARMLTGVNSQVGTTYSFVPQDATRLTTFSNAATTNATLASGMTAGFGIGTVFSVQNLGPGSLIITCQFCLIFSNGATGAGTLTVAAGQGADLYGGSINYTAQTGGVASGTLTGDNVSIQVQSGVISATNPFTVGAINASATANFSTYTSPNWQLDGDPFGLCIYQGNATLQQLQFCNTGAALLLNFGNGGPNQQVFTIRPPQGLITPGAVPCYVGVPNNDYEIGLCGGVQNQTLGASAVGMNLTGLMASLDGIRVSAWCNNGVLGALSNLTCLNYPDESQAVKALVNFYGGSQNVINDMCSTQTWSTPLPNSFSGIFADLHNCGSNPHVMQLDGMATWTLPSNAKLVGMGANSFSQSPNNSWIQPCNPYIENCVNGGWSQQSATITGFTVVGDVGTITVAGTPFDVNANDVDSVQVGRLLCIYGATTQLTPNSCWFVKAVVSATAPQQFSVWVVSGVTQSCTPGTCGTVYLEQPVVNIGTGNGNAAFHSSVSYFTISGNYMPASGCFVESQGEEDTGTEGFIQAFNCTAYYFRWDQSGAYAGAAGGDTNSMGSGALAGNFGNVLCEKTGGCACPGVTGSTTSCSSSTTGVNGTAPVGSIMGCGAGTGKATILFNGFDPCWNQNFFGLGVLGLAGNQGPGKFKGHVTMSIADKTLLVSGHPIPQLEGGTTGSCGSTSPTTSCPNGVPATGTGIVCAGSSCQFDHTHVEYFSTGYEIGGNSARNASLEEEFGGVLTSGVHFDGCFSAFNSGGVGFDLGQSGNGAFVTNILIDGCNIGVGSGNAFVDNIAGNSCSDQTISYERGNNTNPVLKNTCTTGKAAMELPRFMVMGTAPTCAFTSGGGTGSPSCTVDTGSTDTAGIIILTTGSSASGTGTVTLTFTTAAAFGTNKPTCAFTASDEGAGSWNGLAVMKDKIPSTTSDLFTWTNGTTPTSLSNTTAYWINYHCWAK
jgi:hypothetical protein